MLDLLEVTCVQFEECIIELKTGIYTYKLPTFLAQFSLTKIFIFRRHATCIS